MGSLLFLSLLHFIPSPTLFHSPSYVTCLPSAQHSVRAGNVDVNKTHGEGRTMSTGAVLIASGGPKAGSPFIAPMW